MPNFALRLTLLALALISLTACAAVNSNPACACPPIKYYAREFQRKLAAEIEAAPQEAVFPEVVMDYAMLRAELRVCR